jgi:hypothetical protein
MSTVDVGPRAVAPPMAPVSASMSAPSPFGAAANEEAA